MSSSCPTCFDTRTIDQAGAVVACPECKPLTVKLTGLRVISNSLSNYYTLVAHTATTLTFIGTRNEIAADVQHARRMARFDARQAGLKGRNYVESFQIAVVNRVGKALHEIAVAANVARASA